MSQSLRQGFATSRRLTNKPASARQPSGQSTFEHDAGLSFRPQGRITEASVGRRAAGRASLSSAGCHNAGYDDGGQRRGRGKKADLDAPVPLSRGSQPPPDQPIRRHADEHAEGGCWHAHGIEELDIRMTLLQRSSCTCLHTALLVVMTLMPCLKIIQQRYVREQSY